jgi:tripartite-type tricarboxylate transporter receptor subunit TctC
MHFKSLASRIAMLLCLIFNVQAQAQTQTNFPEKPVKLIVPFPPGQATDIIARMIAEKLTLSWGQQVIVENKTGVPGMVAGSTAAPDGYTMTMGTSGVLAVNPAVFDKLPYDVTKDFIYVGGLAITPMIVVVSAALPYNTVQELVAAAKKEPGKFNVGYGGVNNTQHLTGELFKFTTGVNMVGVNYKGSAAAVTDLLGGQISILVDSMAVALPHIKSGKLRAIGLSSQTRAKALPEVPTMDEQGMPNNTGSWYGLLAPAGTPDQVVRVLYDASVKYFSQPEVRARVEASGSVLKMLNPQQFLAAMTEEKRQLAELNKILNIKMD